MNFYNKDIDIYITATLTQKELSLSRSRQTPDVSVCYSGYLDLGCKTVLRHIYVKMAQNTLWFLDERSIQTVMQLELLVRAKIYGEVVFMKFIALWSQPIEEAVVSICVRVMLHRLGFEKRLWLSHKQYV